MYSFVRYTFSNLVEIQTLIYRKVFHAVPDDTVTTWKQYKDFVLHHERMNRTVH